MKIVKIFSRELLGVFIFARLVCCNRRGQDKTVGGEKKRREKKEEVEGEEEGEKKRKEGEKERWEVNKGKKG